MSVNLAQYIFQFISHGTSEELHHQYMITLTLTLLTQTLVIITQVNKLTNKFPPPLKLRPYGGIEMCVLLLLLLSQQEMSSVMLCAFMDSEIVITIVINVKKIVTGIHIDYHNH